MSREDAKTRSVASKDGKVLYTYILQDGFATIVDVQLSDESTEALDFPEYLEGNVVKEVNIRSSENTFKGVKRIFLSKKIKKFIVKNSQFPNIENIDGPSVRNLNRTKEKDVIVRYSCCEVFIFIKKSLFKMNGAEYLLINVFDTESTGVYNDPFIDAKVLAYANIADYAFEDTKFSDILLGGELREVSDKAFEGSMYKELNKDAPLFTIRTVKDEFALSIKGGALIDVSKLGSLRTMFSQPLNGTPIGDITVSFGETVPKTKRIRSIQIGRSVKNVLIEKGFVATKKTDFLLSSFENVKNIEVDEGANYSVVDNVLFSKDKKTLIYYPPERDGEEYAIPDGTERVFSCAFRRTKKLRKIVFPDTCRILDRFAFDRLNLDEFKLPCALLNQETNWLCNSTVKRFVLPPNTAYSIPSLENRSNHVYNTLVEDGVEYLGKSSLKVGYGKPFEVSDDFLRPDLTSADNPLIDITLPLDLTSAGNPVIDITLPPSVKAVSQNAIIYDGEYDGHIINLNGYSYTLNLAYAAFNSMTHMRESYQYVLINLIDKGWTIPICSCMNEQDVDKISLRLNNGDSYANILDDALTAIKPAYLRSNIALSMMPETAGEAKEVLKKHLKKTSGIYAKVLMKNKYTDRLTKLVSYNLCSQNTLKYILSSADNETMCELVSLVSEKVKKRTKRITV